MSRVDTEDLDLDPQTWEPRAPGWDRPDDVLHTEAALNAFGNPQIWHRGGVPWYALNAPIRAHHRHQVQTYGIVGFRQIFRFACSAIAGSDSLEWINLEERFDDTPRPSRPARPGWLRHFVGLRLFPKER